jgi:hypothetical protein
MSDQVYLLFRNDGSGQFPVFRTVEGKAALIMFTCAELAESFIQGRGRKRELHVIEYSRKNFLEWLMEAAKSFNASEIVADPAPEASMHSMKLLPISSFLAQSEAMRAPEKTAPTFRLDPPSQA